MTPLEVAALWAFKIVYHQDRANAAMHMAPVRYSPITFRLAEALSELDGVLDELAPDDMHILHHVLADLGAYAEDPGR